ncbi:MAG: hydroxymethylglutaryl-CoA reductase, degradative [Flavobacteriales bacterium Tduv]
MHRKLIDGFSKKNKEEKANWLVEHFFDNDVDARRLLLAYWHEDEALQKLHDEFSENTISNFYMPFSVAPNFLINDQPYVLPMVIEESSVVAAACKSAKFWFDRGGFKTYVQSMRKPGQVHFLMHTTAERLNTFFEKVLKKQLIKDTQEITRRMQLRGGGILDIKLKDKSEELVDYFQIEALFDTCDAMGANFINSCLEQFAQTLKREAESGYYFNEEEKISLQVIMCVLSNYTPECIADAEVSCPINALKDDFGMTAEDFARKFHQAVNIAEIEPYRATTHNKGIMNGVDAVVIATGNDFRAVEACAHAYSSKNGKYTSLTHCELKDGIFRFWIDLPIAVGTIGGLTILHPLVKLSLKMLGNPSAKKLMEIIAVSGLAQNFAALRSLVTTGIQKGHMKMHLFNILNQLKATESEKKYFINFFKNKTVSHHLVLKEWKKLKE